MFSDVKENHLLFCDKFSSFYQVTYIDKCFFLRSLLNKIIIESWLVVVFIAFIISTMSYSAILC